MLSNILTSALSWFLVEGAGGRLIAVGTGNSWSNIPASIDMLGMGLKLFNSKAETVKTAQQLQNWYGYAAA